MYVCMYVYMYVHIYAHIYVYIYDVRLSDTPTKSHSTSNFGVKVCSTST